MQENTTETGPVDEGFSVLLAHARFGDSDAATELVRRYEPELRRYVRLRLTDSRLRRFIDSIDICQSIFGRFFAGFFEGKYEIQSAQQLIALLLRMAKNEVCDQIRKQHTARRGGPAYCESRLHSVEILTDPGKSPSEEASGREFVAQVLKELPSRERFVAERRIDGFSWAELGIELKTDADVLRKRLSRALQRFR